MTLYLLDVNVLQELKPGGNAQVWTWRRTVRDDQLRLSAFTLFEVRRGWQRQRRKLAANGDDTGPVDAKLAEIARLEAAYRGRIIAIDETIVAEWTVLLGEKDKNQLDAALAATARVHDLVVVTRNVKDCKGPGVKVLDPFKAGSKVVEV